MKRSIILLLIAVNALCVMSQTVKDSQGNAIPDEKFQTSASGLKYYIYESHGMEKPVSDDKVSVHYTGKFLDEKVFDSSVGRGKPLDFTLGIGQVIAGWDEGIALLGKGDKAMFIIPPQIAYGSTERGSIPANSTLVFDVNLVDFTPQKKIEDYKTKGKDTITTVTGLKYIIVEKGKGKKSETGSNVVVHYSGYLKDGKMFDSSVKRGETFKFELGAGQVIRGWDEGLYLMQEGDKFRLIIPYTLAYGEAGRPPQIPEKADLIFDVELIQVLPPIVVEKFDITGKKEYTTASGIKYYIVKEGTGDLVKSGEKVQVHYTGYFLDGKVFDSSVKRGQPIELSVGVGQVIKGWDEGLQLMKKGDKIRFLIPYSLAYGEKGYPGAIPPKADLIFDVELVNIIK